MPDVKPRPPEELVGALHDRAHTDGKLIAATPVRGERTAMAPDLTALADELERLLALSTPGKWKLWGSSVMADKYGTSDVDTATPVASFHAERTFDASLTCKLRHAAPQLVEALRERAANPQTSAGYWRTKAKAAEERLRQAEGLLREVTDEINNRNDNDDACVVCDASWDNGEDHTRDCPVPRLHAFLASPPEPKEAGSE